MELLEKNNISNEFSDTNGEFIVIQDNNVSKNTNNIYINENYIINTSDTGYICTKTLRIIKYYYNNSNNTKNIIMFV